LPKRVKIDQDIDPLASTSFEDINNKSDTFQYNTTDVVLKANDVINFDVKQLLNTQIIGRAILLKYEKGKIIDNKDRNTLCDIIICHFLNEGKRLNNTSLSILADKIIDIFRGENKCTYYVSPIGKNKSRYNKPEVARGKLVDKHRNKLTIIKKTLGTPTSTVQKKTSKFILLLCICLYNFFCELQKLTMWFHYHAILYYDFRYI
jgi:hypothetical protein